MIDEFSLFVSDSVPIVAISCLLMLIPCLRFAESIPFYQRNLLISISFCLILSANVTREGVKDEQSLCGNWRQLLQKWDLMIELARIYLTNYAIRHSFNVLVAVVTCIFSIASMILPQSQKDLIVFFLMIINAMTNIIVFRRSRSSPLGHLLPFSMVRAIMIIFAYFQIASTQHEFYKLRILECFAFIGGIIFLTR